MNHLVPILAFAVFLAAYHTAGVLWGKTAKLSISLGLLVLYAVISLALYFMNRRLLKEHPELVQLRESDSGPLWYWKLLDGILGVIFAVVPPVMVSVIHEQPLTMESEFTGYHLLATAGGIGVYLLARGFVVRIWRQKHPVSTDADKP